MISYCKTILGTLILIQLYFVYEAPTVVVQILLLLLLFFFIPQIVSFVNNLLSNNDASILFFHPESECQCNIEVRIYMYLMVNLKFQPALWMNIVSLSC